MEKMTPERKAEITWLILKNFIKKENIRLDGVLVKQEIGNKAEELGVEPEEIKTIFTELFTELTLDFLNELNKK